MISKFIFTLFLIFAASTSLFGQYFWQRIDSPTDIFLRTLQFTDSLKGWVAGDSGLIFYTSDGGLNWKQQQTNNNFKIMKLFFLNENKGWGVAWDESGSNMFYGTYILKTSDGGETWNSEQYREEDVFLATIYFLDSLKGFMGGYPGKFLITTDGGINWENAQIDSGAFAYFPPVHFNFFNEQYGFAAGGAMDIAGVVWKTTNGGESWKPLNVGSPDPIRAIHFFDSLNVYGIGGDPEFFGIAIIRSTDAGESWTYEEPGIIGVATALSFRTETEAWAPTSFAQTLIYSFDSGNTWTDTSTVDSSRIYDLVFTDSLTGYAVGEEGVILKYKYQYPDFVNDNSSPVVQNFLLFQNFPNPFNPSTTISYYISEPGEVTLKIYNVLGNLVLTLVEDYKSIGNHDVVWNATNKPSGVYYFQLNVNGKFATRKMLLLK
ncbi:MAG: YCF48-related protein [Ignavibacteriaceae bacterium]